MTKRKKIYSMLIAISIICAMAFSVLFVLTEANHDCVAGSCCKICLHINYCLEHLKLIAEKPSAALLPSLLIFLFLSSVKIITCFSNANTLIDLKVKLSS